MSHVYCSHCGAKHLVGAKFCSNCGNSMNAILAPATRKSPLKRREEDVDLDEDGIPTSFSRPAKLEYEIINPSKNKFSVDEIVSRAPSLEREPRQKANTKKLSREEYLSQSLKECAQSKDFKDINES